jgi:DNA-binding CsgD family transcriptional regulator
VLLDAEGSLLFRLDQSRGLANNTILSLYEDRSQNLWMGMDNGLACLEMRSPFSYIDERVGVFGSGYAAALFGGQLLLGTNQGIFAAAWGDPARNAVQEPFRILPESPGQVWSFHTEEDYIWVGRHRGAFRLQGSDLEVLSRADGFWSLWMLAGDSGLALAGAYNGLHLFRRSDVRSPWRYDRPLRGFDESSRVLAQDAEGYVWVSHAYKGIYRLRLSANGDSIAERSYFHSPDGLPADYLVNVARVRGELLFTTPAGIYRFDASSQRFVPDTAFNKALGGARPVYWLIEDAFGDIWFSQEGEFGYLHFRQQGLRQIVEKHLINPLHRQMLDGFEFVLRLAPDQALIGTEKGFIHCRLEDAALGAAAFPVFLRRVASLTQPGSSLFEGTWAGSADAAALRLGSQENNLRFAFAALPDMGSRPCQYRYRLEGLERQWSEWQEEHYKEYTNLPPGAYYFHVEARDAFGRTGAPLRFPFRIYPPWYLSAWAKGAYALLLLLCLAGGAWWMYRRMAHTRQKLEQDKAQALREKEAAFEAEARKSEDEIIRLRNEALRAEVAHKNQELASAAMHLVQKGESLQHIKQELRKVSSQTEGELRRQLLQIIHSIDQDLQLDKNWEQFALHFDQVHEAFLQRLREKYPDLTLREQQLSAYLRMNFSTKEIARLMNISVRGAEIGRYRLRKKLGLDSDTNLVEFIARL